VVVAWGGRVAGVTPSLLRPRTKHPAWRARRAGPGALAALGAEADRRRGHRRRAQRRQEHAAVGGQRCQTKDCRLSVHYPGTQPGRRAIDDRHSFVVADVPGLIEGASQGAGLGHQFLRHVERTRLIVHCSTERRRSPGDYAVINHELAEFSQRLATRPRSSS